MTGYRKNDPGLRVEEAIVKLVVAEFARLGLTATVTYDENGPQVTLPSGGAMFLANTIGIARGEDPNEWPALVARMVAAERDSHGLSGPETLSAGELRSRIRARLIADVADDLYRVDYGRRFAPGIVQVLCLDYPSTVTMINDESIPDMALSLDEMFRIGQMNTDAEPIDEFIRLDEYVMGLSGDSMFIASKAASFRALTPQVIGPAPRGVVFNPLNRNSLLYSVLGDDDPLMRLVKLTQAADRLAFDPQFHHAGGLISSQVYYWAPDGTVERVAGRTSSAEGKATIDVRPTPSFDRYTAHDGEGR